MKRADIPGFLEMVVTGTKHEELLRILSGRQDKKVTLHLCPEDCGQQLADEKLIHAEFYEVVGPRKVPWLTNPQGVIPEMADLREEQKRMLEEVKQRKKKENKKEEKKRKQEASEEGRGRKSLKFKKDEIEKPLAWVFGDTGMDPTPKKRAKILKKAR